MSEAENDRLWEVYEEHCAYAGVPLREFLGELQRGTHGEFSPDAVVELLERLLSSVLQNIDMMADSNPALADQADDKKEEQAAFYRALIDEIRSPKPDS